jgi:RimJ/RimL family protein N-acetyltransferase
MPILKGPNIRLRLFDPSEIEAHVAHLNTRDVYPDQSFTLVSFQKFASLYAQNNFLTADSGVLAIDVHRPPTPKKHIGHASFYVAHPSLENLEVDVKIHLPAHNTSALHEEAYRLLCGYLFSERPIARLQTMLAPNDETGKKGACAAGFKHEGRLVSMFFANGRWCDLDLYAVLREEWAVAAR